jgi:hypothetical protein
MHHNLYLSVCIIRAIKSRMSWAEHVAYLTASELKWRNLKGSDLLGDLGVNGKVMLKWPCEMMFMGFITIGTLQ